MTTKPPTCTHQNGVDWVPDDGRHWHESELLVGRGHWECKGCQAMVESPAGTGICPLCNRPMDAHDDVGTNHQVCWRRSRA